MEPKIQLNTNEQELFNILLNVAQKLAPGTTLRAVGGFVRDKLLGKDCHDIDIMVDNMPGEDFAKLVTQYLGSKEANVIKANPDKTKNITTAKAFVPLPSGPVMEVDFAQARQEIYQTDSRNPEVKPATAQEDAIRRDATVNAIFYNLSTQQVEDFTGQGLSDLKNGILRAPGVPLQRFLDDPLRVLRLARFSSKLNFKLDPATWEAMKNPKVLSALHNKVSKERVGEEFEKILKSPHSEYGIRLLQESGIFQQLIADSIKGTDYEGKMAPWNMGQNNAHHKLSLDQHTLKVLNNLLKMYPEASPEKRLIMSLTALFHDFGKMFREIHGTTPFGSTSYHGHEDHSKILAELFLKHVKLDKHIPQVSPLVEGHMRPHVLVDDQSSSKSVRRLLRDLAEDGVHWVDLLNHAEADATAKGETLDAEDLAYIQNMNLFREKVKAIEQEMATMNVNLQKPILNGNELMQIFNNNRPGPWIGEISQWLKDLMLNDVNLTKERAVEKVKEQFPQYIQPIKTAAIASDILIDKVKEQILGCISEEPYKAFALATNLWKDHPDDERTLVLCLQTAIGATKLGKNVCSEEVYLEAKKLAEDRFFNPEIISLFLVYKTIMNKPIYSTDLEAAQRASIMNPRIMKENYSLILEIGCNSNWEKFWKKFSK